MPRGHRRTQSSTIACGSAEECSTAVKKEVSLTSSEIVSLLARSEDRVEQKVSSVESLQLQTHPDSSLFNFGRTLNRHHENSAKNYLREEYMMPIPERREGPDCTERTENAVLGSNPFSRKGRSGIGVG